MIVHVIYRKQKQLYNTVIQCFICDSDYDLHLWSIPIEKNENGDGKSIMKTNKKTNSNTRPIKFEHMRMTKKQIRMKNQTEASVTNNDEQNCQHKLKNN